MLTSCSFWQFQFQEQRRWRRRCLWPSNECKCEWTCRRRTRSQSYSLTHSLTYSHTHTHTCSLTLTLGAWPLFCQTKANQKSRHTKKIKNCWLITFTQKLKTGAYTCERWSVPLPLTKLMYKWCMAVCKYANLKWPTDKYLWYICTAPGTFVILWYIGWLF